MGKPIGTRYDNPRYELQNGTLLSLKPVSALLVQRFQLEWEQSHAMPQPAIETLSNGDKWPNDTAPSYVAAMDLWARWRNDAVNAFVLKAGIQNRPDTKWKNEWEVATGDPVIAWLYSQIEADDLEGLINAIMGLVNATETAIADAVKN